MPIIYVHGVNTRNFASGYTKALEQVEMYLRRFIAPVIAPDPDNVLISSAYWGGVAASFAWEGASRPRTPLLGMGGGVDQSAFNRAIAVSELGGALDNLPASVAARSVSHELSAGGLVPVNPTNIIETATSSAAPIRLKDFTPEQLSDLLAVIVAGMDEQPVQRVQITLAYDEVAHDPDTFLRLAAAPDSESELAVLQDLLTLRLRSAEGEGGLAGMGVPQWLSKLRENVSEALGRAGSLPGYVVSRAVVEARKPLNDLVTYFIADVPHYLIRRGNGQRPGDIPLVVLNELGKARANQRQRSEEPIIVLSHSMGGQVIYDLVPYQLNNKGFRLNRI